jgi:hypothetical protein
MKAVESFKAGAIAETDFKTGLGNLPKPEKAKDLVSLQTKALASLPAIREGEHQNLSEHMKPPPAHASSHLYRVVPARCAGCGPPNT